MATTYKTPGVYIEEIVKFPPSVAQVETAIPAFIGYTEKATNKIKGDLKLVPTRITSLLDYEKFFGAAKPETTISVTVNDVVDNGTTTRSVVVNQPSSRQPFLMYYSMQLFFANGGGPCYIISVGRYGDDLDDTDTKVTSINDSSLLKKGLLELEKMDEPTLILFPDATQVTSITKTDFYGLYNDALNQCKKLQDRFTIIDTLSYDASSPTDTNVDDLRGVISSEKDTLKYGAAYYPHLETILDYRYNASEIKINHFTSPAPDAMSTVLSDLAGAKTEITPIIDKLKTVPVTNDNLTGSIAAVLNFIESPAGFDNGGAETFSVAKNTLFIPLLETLTTDLTNLIGEKEKIKKATKAAIASDEEDQTTRDAISAALKSLTDLFEKANTIESVKTNLADLLGKAKAANTQTKVTANIKGAAGVTTVLSEISKILHFTTPSSILGLPAAITFDVDLFKTIISLIDGITAAVTAAKPKDTNNGAMNGRFLGDITGLDNATYNKILAEISNLSITLPPSSAIAGIYARVDGDRGVWKAPANVSLNYVISPTVKITNNIQDGLNVDTVAGKSINAIRTFTGKGTLVWGSRTLAGNDNEWRYVPVRRFFNMAEESIKKATEQFVFEPNDANTWVRVRAMIENFLILQWRAGALAGAKPDQAFYVRVGLGQTMSAIDILEGRMIIEIGMAVVRPAEYIILRFSHKMQES
jgi:phage tail sheath protein FI